MSRQATLVAALTAAIALAAASRRPASGAEERPSLHGQWMLREHSTPDKIQLNLRYSIDGKDQGNWGRSMPFSAARGLRTDAYRVPGPVSFEVVRDAGAFVCTGTMDERGGGGSFEFRPDPEFVRTLERRGVGRPDEQQQMILALAGVEVALLDALEAGGYPRPDVPMLLELGQHGVTHAYVLDLTDAGYKLGSLRRLREARDHGVTGTFARELAAAGLGGLDYDRLLTARDHGVTAEFIHELAAAGYSGLSYEQLLRTRDHGVTGEFIRELAEAGYRGISLEQLIRTRDHGVTADYVAYLEDAGFRDMPLASVIKARDHGMTRATARKARAALGPQATLEDAIYWKDHAGR